MTYLGKDCLNDNGSDDALNDKLMFHFLKLIPFMDHDYKLHFVQLMHSFRLLLNKKIIDDYSW